MAQLTTWKKLTLAIVGAGLCVPPVPLTAAPTAAVKSASRDVALGNDGSISGQALTDDGAVLDGALITLTQGEKEIAQTVTDQEGRFAMANLAPGSYVLTVGARSQRVRLWDTETAPAGRNLVEDGRKLVVRAQGGGETLAIVGGVAIITALGITWYQYERVKNQNEDYKNQNANNASP